MQFNTSRLSSHLPSSLFGISLGAALLLAVLTASETSLAKTSHSRTPPGKFQPLEQPLPLKVGLTVAGLGLIGLELWWFLGHKPVSHSDSDMTPPPR